VRDDEVKVTSESVSIRSLASKRIADAGDTSVTSTIDCVLEELASSLAGILEDLKRDGRRWVVIIETVGEAKRYVQVLVTREGGLWAECVSDEFLPVKERLSDQQRELLPLLGWQWPSPPEGPNWQFHDELLNTGTAISGLMLRTLREVFGIDSMGLVRFRLFQSAHGDHRAEGMRSDET
jgi:hypothetical protein